MKFKSVYSIVFFLFVKIKNEFFGNILTFVYNYVYYTHNFIKIYEQKTK